MPIVTLPGGELRK